MKKRILFALVILAAAFLAGCGGKELAAPVPQDKPLYGYTEDGVFFIHDALVKNAEADHVSLRSQTSEYKPRKMHHEGDYWVYNVKENPEDGERFRFYRDFTIEYVFDIGEGRTIPNQLIKHKEWFNPEELHFKGGEGHAFRSEPVKNAWL